MKWTLVFTVIIFIMLMGAASATTYYVSKTGSDSYNGTSWATAWATIAKVNQSMAGGDTVFFGSGIWRGTTLVAISGTTNDWTTYACSSFAAVNGQGRYHFAKIFASDSIGTWSRIGTGNTYRAAWSGTVSALFQNDSLLWIQSDSASVNAPGKCWIGSGRIVVYLYNIGGLGNSPANYDIEGTSRHAVDLYRNGDGVTHVTLWGLHFSNALDRLIDNDYSCSNYDYVRIDHCKLTNTYGWGGINPSLIYSPMNGSGADMGEHNQVRACSLAGCWAYGDNMAELDNAHGNGITYYGQRYAVIESCTFYGTYTMTGLYFKNDNSSGWFSEYDTVRYNTFTCNTPSVRTYNCLRYIIIYGNTFIGANSGVRLYYSGNDTSGYFTITNNTFYNSTLPIRHWDYEGAGHRLMYNKIKYNVVYGSSALVNLADGDTQAHGTLADSNMYYTAAFRLGSTDRTQAQWQAAGFDVRSNFSTNPGFNNPGGNDFSRPNSSQEMNATYGGRTWTRYGAIQAYIPDTTPPSFGNISAGGITASGATITWTTNEPATSQVNYGFTVSYGLNSTLDQTLVSSHSVVLSGLQPDTVYHFRVRSSDGSANEGISGDYQFHTLVVDTAPPTFSNVGTSNIADHNATVTWNTNEPANTQLEYGFTTSYGSTSTLDASMVTAHTVNLTGLTADTLYHFRARSRDAAGNLGLSTDFTFRTLTGDTAPPAFSAVLASNITDHTAVVSWITNESATTQLDYGLTASYGSTTTLDPALLTVHIANLASLTADTLYHYRARSRDAAGNLGISGDYTFRTLQVQALENVSIGLHDSVSSTYDGYSPICINDGVIAPRGGTGTTWASGESATSPHWVEMYFDTLRTVSMARIYWAWNATRTSWMCSQQYYFQYWNQSTNSYVDAALVNNSTVDSVTTTQFTPFTTRKIRYWQPANMGPPNYARIVWLSEILFYGPNVPPAAVDDLGMLPFDSGSTKAWFSPIGLGRQLISGKLS